MPTIYIDTRQKKGKHESKHALFSALDYTLEYKKLDVGDYMLEGKPCVSVDTKQNIQELHQNLCGRKVVKENGRTLSEHERFRNECIRAQEAGIKLFVLVETPHVTNLDELAKWREPNDEYYRRGGRKFNQKTASYNKNGARRYTPQRIWGKSLSKACRTMQDKYGVSFVFCHPDLAGSMTLSLLQGISQKLMGGESDEQ